MSRTKWYWILQISGWTLYGIIGLIVNGMFKAPDAMSVVFSAASATLMLGTTHFLRFLIKRYQWLDLPFWILILRVLAICIGFAMLVNLFYSAFLWYVVKLFSQQEFSVMIFFLYVFQTTIYYALWVGIYLGVHYFRNYKQEEIEKWKLQSAVKDAELIALKAQINPHFLFNALNNIRALILEDHMKARDMVAHLSDLLRYSIQFNNKEKVTVAEELEIVNNYLELETIHYEQRLSYQILQDGGVKRCKIPPMIIQLMVENAIKHGISQVKGGGEVIVHLKDENTHLNIEVSNTGRLLKTEKEGIGIRNATERIKILFDEEPDFQLYQDGEFVKSILSLPKEV